VTTQGNEERDAGPRGLRIEGKVSDRLTSWLANSKAETS
jgi:hypothetical protein